MNTRRALWWGIALMLAATVLVAQRDSATASGGALLYTIDAPNQQSGVHFGSALATGDVNGDGTADTIVGAPGEDVGGNSSQGRVYVFSGGGDTLLYSLDTPNPQTNAAFGASVAAGDVNGDGKADVIVGAPGELFNSNSSQGRAYVFSGGDGSLLYTLTAPDPNSYGFGVAAAVGDVNGDGNADIVIGMVGDYVSGPLGGKDRAYVFAGPDGSWLYTLASPNPEGGQPYFGYAVAAADLNGDGRADIIVGAPGEDPGGVFNAGRAYIFSGADGSVLRTLTAPPGAGGFFGESVAAGDVNSDTVPDTMVGSQGGTGHVLVFSGVDGSLLHDLLEPNPVTVGSFGSAIAAGDVNGDGNADIVVAAHRRGPGGDTYLGRAYAFSGTDGSLLLALTTTNPQPYPGFDAAGAAPSGKVDGRAGVVVGACCESASAIGRVYVFSAGDSVDTDGDGCFDPWEYLQIPATDPADPWDFYSVPVPALFAAPDPTTVLKDDVVSAGDAEAVFAYFKKAASTGSTEYEQDLNLNGTRDGLEYDRSVIGPGQSGPPDGVVAAADAQLAFAQFKLGYKCKF